MLAFAIIAVPAASSDAQARRDNRRLEAAANARLAENQTARINWTAAALAARGHSGDQTFLMGCDLFSPELEAERRLLEAAIANPSATALPPRLDGTASGGPHIRPAHDALLPSEPERWVTAAFAADQAHRTAMDQASGDISEHSIELLLEASCALDLAHTEGLEQVLTALDTLSRTGLEQAFALFMHQDHRPDLQERAAAFFLARANEVPELGLFGARLKDRSLINRGLPQAYGELFNCADRRPDGPPPDVAAIDRRRLELGLASFSETVARACGG